jgi:2-desacetyl-2-hydroxyethyl bacteriochlorophyllide A dehydrogenase
MEALVKYGNKPHQLEVRNVPVPSIGPQDVLLEVKATGICGWDIEMWLHTMAYPVTVPVIQGHEFCGVIKEMGDHVKGFSIGDRVVSETAAVICGQCDQCRSGNYHLCPDRKGFGYGVDGAFTDFVKVPQRCLHHIPKNVSFEFAALTEPACVAYQAMATLSDIRPKKPLLIIGPGPVGLFCVQIARICGASPIILAGTSKDEDRLNIGEQLGANLLLDVMQTEPVQYINEKTDDHGVPLVIDAAGNKKSLQLAMDAVARNGQITKIGWGPEPIDFSLDPLLKKAVRLQGTFSHNWPTWEAVLSLISQNKIQMEPMISHKITLNQWQETFETIEQAKSIKAIMIFNR